MKVSELIKELQQMDQSRHVYVPKQIEVDNEIDTEVAFQKVDHVFEETLEDEDQLLELEVIIIK